MAIADRSGWVGWVAAELGGGREEVGAQVPQTFIVLGKFQ